MEENGGKGGESGFRKERKESKERELVIWGERWITRRINVGRKK